MEDVLGVPVPCLPDDFIPTECIILLKGFMEHGATLAVRYSTGLTKWEAIGMLTAELDNVRAQLREDWEGTEED